MQDQIKTTAEAVEAAALPRAHAVHSDPEMTCAEVEPFPEALSKQPAGRKSQAKWAYQRLIHYIRNFEKQLDEEHEVAMGFVGGAPGVLKIEGLGYFDPDIVTFYGKDSKGVRTQLVQHVSQLNVFLRATPKPKEAPQPTRIGFRLVAGLEEDEAE
ncbi:DUF6173 family protein [Tranquillimonas alkanivorans]|uniref:Uncharacterized protein n=1 Tax=Tranquillimonas alkanivorans TaxID=441119 RepID=A0A1I5KXZ2_9RHOB|nr:DUF6173 family protein [Tranquillimonas alkanivorans]SFO89506.1 hypothetical protein SAMN04488047_101346 [Tranquillimonas alkanivorans]